MNGDSYRRGYREGWLAAIHRMKQLVEEKRLSLREAYAQCYGYRKRLHEWTLKKDASASSLSPPRFED